MSITVVHRQQPQIQQPQRQPDITDRLSNLIYQKMENFERSQGIQDRKGTYKKLGLPEALAELPDDLQTLMLKEYDFLPPEQKEAVREQFNAINDQYNAPEDLETEVPTEQVRQPQLNALAPFEKPKEPTIPQALEGLESKKIKPREPLIQRKGAKEAQRKEALELSKEERKEQHLAAKETKPYYDEVTKEAKAAKDNDLRLNRMEELVNKGNIRSPFYNNLFETLSHGIFGFGIDLHFLQNADTQEFRKLSNDMLKSAKDTFGSRLTDYDVKTFLATLPTLSQSDEGKLRVINNLKIFNDMAKLKKQAMDQIIRENGNKRPANLDVLVDERISPQADQYAETFKRGY